MSKRKKAKSILKASRILIGLIVGSLAALVLNPFAPELCKWFEVNISSPIGKIFLNALKMIVAPLVLSTLSLGIANLANKDKLGRLGRTTIFYYLSTTFFAIVIGLFMVNTFRPGEGVDPSIKESLSPSINAKAEMLIGKSTAAKDALWPDLFVNIVPSNIFKSFTNMDMLSIIFLSILLGLCLLSLGDTKTKNLRNLLQEISDLSLFIIDLIMKTAPYAVAALMFSTIINFGSSILTNLGQYMLVVFSSYLLQFILVYGLIVSFFLKMNPLSFLKKAGAIFLTAFSTSSSSATMPTTMSTLENNFDCPREITAFCIPLGATINMDGTAMFECIAALFVAQIFGIELSLAAQVSMIFLILLSSIGVAGVPGGSIPLLIAAMVTFGIPAEGVAIILGVDRLLDMGRTTLNVTGDTIGALILKKVEKV